MARRLGIAAAVALSLCAIAPAAGAAAATAPMLSVTAQHVGADGAIVIGQRLRSKVILQPFVAGQVVTVTFVRHGRVLAKSTVALAPSPSGGSGQATIAYTATKPGTVEVHATHAASAELGPLEANPARVRALRPSAQPGAIGPVVRLLQRKLSALGYVVGRRGVYDARTARAVLAFRKVTGMARIAVASSSVFRTLDRGAGRFRVRYPSHGKHLEADLSLQVFALIRGRRVERIYPISSGAPATPTVLGSFRVYLKTPGTNAKGMVESSYFFGGYAVHGYVEVPTVAASHGCLRVPVPDARAIYDWLAVGDRVDVYR